MFSEAADYGYGLFEQDASEPANADVRQDLDMSNLSGDEFQREANLNAQNPTSNLVAITQTDPKATKNQAVLKEAKRLFGEPEMLEI